jgi:hypothetical protein
LIDCRAVQPDRVSQLLARSGLVELARAVREPQDGKRTRQAYMLAESGEPGPRDLTRCRAHGEDALMCR